MTRPNILWICTDQQRYDTLGCNGNRFVRTPVLDKLAENSVVFDQCYCQSPVCSPSRASFLTGRYPRTTRCRQNGQDTPADEVLVTKLLADAGYKCGLSGKLHIASCNPALSRSMEPRIDDGYSVFHWSHDPWVGPEYRDWLASKGARVELRPHPDSEWVHYGPKPELTQAAWCADRAIDFIRAQSDSDSPWLFSVNPFDPHHPFDPPEEFLKRYEAFLDDIPLPNYVEGELDNKTIYQQTDHLGAYSNPKRWPAASMTPTDHRLVRAAYWAMCDNMDVQVGRMLDALRETGQLDNTIVIYTADHGEMLGDHGIYCKGPYFYDCAIHVPLMISWPGFIRPERTSALVELTDLAQTLLDAAGLRHHPGMQGLSLWPALTRCDDLHHHRDDIYCECYNSCERLVQPDPHLTMVRTASHKLVVDHTNSTGELYDLKLDPNETVNRWHDPALIHTKAELLLRLTNLMAWTVDPLPERLAPW
jgi:arylsulfatase